MYESHFLSTLVNQGGMSRGGADSTLMALVSPFPSYFLILGLVLMTEMALQWTILTEKIEEGSLDRLELNFGIVSLRRR